MTKIFKSISIFVRIDEYFRNQLIDKLKNIWSCECEFGCCVYDSQWNCFKIMISAGVLWTAFIYCVITFFFSTSSCCCSFLLPLLGFGCVVSPVSTHEQSSFSLVIHLKQQNDRVKMYKRREGEIPEWQGEREREKREWKA